MRKFEKLAIILIVLSVIEFGAGIITPLWIVEFIGSTQTGSRVGDGKFFLLFISAVAGIVKSIFCGIWLFFEAKNEKQNRWVWLGFGLAFNVIGILIFVAYRILDHVRNQKTDPDAVGNG